MGFDSPPVHACSAWIHLFPVRKEEAKYSARFKGKRICTGGVWYTHQLCSVARPFDGDGVRFPAGAYGVRIGFF
jgi:hypothetical protein